MSFNKAIEMLRMHSRKSFGYPEKDTEQFKAACRVLEAAAKIDKETVMVVLGDARTLLAREGRTAFIWAIKDAIALLAALPDDTDAKEKP